MLMGLVLAVPPAVLWRVCGISPFRAGALAQARDTEAWR